MRKRRYKLRKNKNHSPLRTSISFISIIFKAKVTKIVMSHLKRTLSMKTVLIFILVLTFQIASAQTENQLKEIEPLEEYENIHVRKLNSDSAQTSFVIWIKKAVKAHYHAFHTENIYVIDGKAEMSLNDSTFIVKKGDYLNIPKGSIHSVNKVYGKKPLKVLSIQSPEFKGKDRIFVETQKANHEDY